MLRLLACSALAVAVSTAACRKKTEAPAPPPAEAAPAVTPETPAPVGGEVPLPQPPVPSQSPGLEKIEDRLPTAPPDSSKSNPVDQKLTEALHHYLEAHGRLPPDFSALVTAKIIKQVPAPPAGKRYAVDRRNLQVVVLNQ